MVTICPQGMSRPGSCSSYLTSRQMGCWKCYTLDKYNQTKDYYDQVLKLNMQFRRTTIMNKMKNRFLALLVVFTSIISFLSVGFGGQAANAAATGTDPTAVKVYTDSNSELTPRTDTTTKEVIYTTASTQNSFDITVDDLRVAETLALSQTKLEDDASTNKRSVLGGIVNQKLDIVSVNGTSWETVEGHNILANEIGVNIVPSKNPNISTKRIGQSITGLPLGVNKIEYRVTVTTQDVVYVAPKLEANGVYVDQPLKVSPPSETSFANQKLTIEHATGFVISKINPMIFNAFIGKASDFDPATGAVLDDDLRENNTVPFLYSATTSPDKNMQLRYTFDVPDSTSTLTYNMFFDATMVLTNAKIYKNGERDLNVDYDAANHKLTGNLQRLGTSDLIVVKLDSSSGDKNIQKAYALEIRYNNLGSDKDFSVKDAGITKLDYDDDKNVKAFIGKKFTVKNDTSGLKVYTGTIDIDSKARMISIEPTLQRSKDTVAYVVTNKYVDSLGTSRVKQSVLKNGKQFIDFMASTTSNEIQVDVYEGKNGNVTDSSKPLVRYLLKVNTIRGNEFTMDLAFDSATHLTQPGVKENIIDKFTTDRRSYDLYSGDPVNVSFIGKRSDKNEYIRVWLADSIASTNPIEAQASIDNKLDSSNVRKTSLDVKLGTAKKMVVQAYYDEFQSTQTTGAAVGFVSNPVGDKYVFYLPNNYDNTTPPINGENSTNALLNSLKFNGYPLKDSDGNESFSSDKFDYTTTVAKEDTTTKITAVAQDDNIKSIVATIDGRSESYDLVSGEVSELPLNSSGTTTIQIVVTAQDGTTSKTYTVVVKNNTKSNNVNLKNVILNVGDYTFDPTADTTKVRVDQNVTNITVSPIAENSKSTVTVNGERYSASAISVSLKGIQKTEISIEVTSEDGTASKTYTLEIYRVDIADWNNDPNNSNNGNDPTEADQFYDEYNECWVDLTKYEEWGSVNGKPTYFDKKSRQVKEAWITTGGKMYYLNNLGYRASGWKVDNADGKAYYLDPTTGELKKGWMNLNNSWYYLGLNGVMHKGWLSLNGKWYYFTPNGQMVINQSMFVEDKVYNFGQDGAIY